MKSLINQLIKYIVVRFAKIDFKDVEFRSETETVVTLKMRLFGHKKFIKNYKDSSEWYEYNSFLLYHDIREMKHKVKKMSDYPGGKDYEYVLDLVLRAVLDRPEIKGIYIENSRNIKLEELLN